MVQTPRFVTLAQFRSVTGITDVLISDDDVNELIAELEFEVEKILNTSFTPLTRIEIKEGTNFETMVLDKNPILKLRALKIDDEDITISAVRVDAQPGILRLVTTAEARRFRSKDNERNLVRIRYDHGVLEDSTTQTDTTSDVSAGDSVVIPVLDETGFSIGDFVQIIGFDSLFETVKVTATASDSITVDNLSTDHESGSLMTLQRTPKHVERMMLVAAGLAGVARVVGSTFDEITGYSVGELQVQKGEPFTQFRETAQQFQNEWVKLTAAFRPRSTIV